MKRKALQPLIQKALAAIILEQLVEPSRACENRRPNSLFGLHCAALVFPSKKTQDTIMEAERINLIGNTLEDLSERTQDLRRYL